MSDEAEKLISAVISAEAEETRLWHEYLAAQRDWEAAVVKKGQAKSAVAGARHKGREGVADE
jgi:hypothetical protein